MNGSRPPNLIRISRVVMTNYISTWQNYDTFRFYYYYCGMNVNVSRKYVAHSILCVGLKYEWSRNLKTMYIQIHNDDMYMYIYI